MTENVEQPPVVSSDSDGAKKSAAPTKGSSETSKTPGKSGSIIAIFSFLLAVIALVGIGGIGWKGYEFTQQFSQLELRLQQTQANNIELSEQVAGVELLAQQQKQQLIQNAQRLAQLPGADRNDWLLAEAEYLLRLANQRLNLEKDWQSAIVILEAADAVLADANSPLLLPVRQQIAAELQALKAVPAIDTTGAVTRLQALQDKISELEWMPRTLPQVTAKVDVDEAEEKTAWQKFSDKVWAGIGVVVRIREHEEALPAPLTPDQHYYLQQNMHLMLEQAQVALVRQQDALYKQSIERTQIWLDEFVMIKNDQAIAAKNTLAELQGWNVSPKFPEISGSLNKLRQILDQQRRGSILPAQAAN